MWQQNVPQNQLNVAQSLSRPLRDALLVLEKPAKASSKHTGVWSTASVGDRSLNGR
jgi:hypothetical protein